MDLSGLWGGGRRQEDHLYVSARRGATTVRTEDMNRERDVLQARGQHSFLHDWEGHARSRRWHQEDNLRACLRDRGQARRVTQRDTIEHGHGIFLAIRIDNERMPYHWTLGIVAGTTVSLWHLVWPATTRQAPTPQ